MKIPLPALFALLFTLAPLHAQDTPAQNQEAAGPRGFWQASLPGGHYMVALNRVTAVSRHQYLLEGSLIVDEVTIDTTGQSLARFYSITPVSGRVPGAFGGALTDRAADLIDRAGQQAPDSLETMVVKKYPDTTHARTVEYRLLSADQLASLYDSVRKAWENNRGTQFTAK